MSYHPKPAQGTSTTSIYLNENDDILLTTLRNLHSPTRDATTSTIAMAMLFGSVVFATASLASKLWLTGHWNWKVGGPVPVADSRDDGGGSGSGGASIVTERSGRSHYSNRNSRNNNNNNNNNNNHLPAHNNKKKSQALDPTSLPSLYALLSHSSAFGLILFYSYLCEHHPPHPHEEKSYDRDEFFFWCILTVVFAGGQTWMENYAIPFRGGVRSAGERIRMMKKWERMMSEQEERKIAERGVGGKRGNRMAGGGDGDDDDDGDGDEEDSVMSSSVSFLTNQLKPSKVVVAPTPPSENEVLNRYQTEEWKGWMQFTFLLYHYMHATEVYNGIRIMITCYVWMTGFGNFSFFYMTNDYSLPRILQMLWRLNFLVLFLCLTHGNPYILYYICPLHTYFFFMVYAVMSIGKERNYTKWWIRIKLAILAIIIFLIWDVDLGIFERLHQFFLGYEPVVGASMGTMWEWYFRSYLDHWSTLLGMVFALNFPIVSLFYRKLEARSIMRQWLGKLAVASGMLYALHMWATGPLTISKIPYNGTNPYFGFIPLVTYIFLRNLTPKLRSHSMAFLHEIGKTTLETYLMQHHIWLTSNSKTVLVFIPGWPRVNLALVTYVYVIICRKVHKLTLHLRGMLLPDDRAVCIRSMVGLAVVIIGFYSTAFVFGGMDMSGLKSIGLVSMVGGWLLYQTVIDSTWFEYRRAAKKAKMTMASSEEDDDDDVRSDSSQSYDERGTEYESAVSRMCPPIIGTMVLLVLGLVWSGFATEGAGSVGLLPPGCDAFVNDGQWIPIDGCNESSRGMAYRDYGADAYGSCAPHGVSYVWAWTQQPPRTHCRFSHRDEEKMKKMLNRRKVVFIGDSMTRYLYHSTVRALGIEGSGAYDATGPKHADIHHTLWETTPVTFRWAPLATDQLNILKEYNKISSAGEGYENLGPDLIVLGGGAWDRLHLYATDEDRQSHAATLKDLGYEMQKAQRDGGSAVVWFIPTTINSKALNTEEKRDHMREEDMEAMRAVYARNGILASSSFVIDGPSFTASRVKESYDGVHYPPHVYDAGAQILFNAIDWLLPAGGVVDPIIPPRAGKMANPTLGVMILVFIAMGLFCFDGFLGFSYLAAIFVKGVMPLRLYEEAFSTLHKKIGLVGADVEGTPSGSARSSQRRLHHQSGSRAGRRVGSVDEEIAALLGTKRVDVELASR